MRKPALWNALRSQVFVALLLFFLLSFMGGIFLGGLPSMMSVFGR